MTRPNLGGRGLPPRSTGPAPLIAIVATPTIATVHQASVTRASIPRAQARAAAMIGTPAGANGVSTSAIAAPRSAAVRACGSIQVRHEQREEQRRERGVQSEPSGVADQVAEQDTRRRPDDPRRVEDEAAAHDELRVVPAAAVGGQGPGLVDDELGAQEPGPPRPRERRRHAHPDRRVAGVEEDRRDHGRREGPARAEDRGRRRTAPNPRTSSSTSRSARPSPSSVARGRRTRSRSRTPRSRTVRPSWHRGRS